jgi:rfaE bifunctional protein nucleotidyltransferase chain/domain
MSVRKKLVPFAELVRIAAGARHVTQTVVHCHGVFDLLHIGHIRYLQSAKQLGDLLLVTVTPDQHVNKGPHRPVFEEKLRAQAIAALDCVDYVSVNCWATARETLRELRPHVYVKGAEYRDQKTPELLAEEAEAAALGTRVAFIEDLTSSSTALINNYLSPFSEETDEFLFNFRRAHGSRDLLAWMERAKQLKVLVVGEGILDEYVSCSTLGQSTKSPNVVGRYLGEQRFLGGALAVANHLAGFCDAVQLMALLGSDQSCEDWIRARLKPAVHAQFVYKPQASTIVKRQYREAYFGTTLFEVDNLNEDPLAEAETQQLDQLLAYLAPRADVVVVTDYGHGMLGASAVRTLCGASRYLAVSAPANAANLGYHTITKYPRAGYVALAEQELRLDRRSRGGSLPEMLQALAEAMETEQAAVTVGKQGCLCYSAAAGHVQAPALATRVVDRFGAGEAFLAVTALCAALRVPLEELAFLGNVAGAEAVAMLGNATFLEEVSFRRHVESLLKG